MFCIGIYDHLAVLQGSPLKIRKAQSTRTAKFDPRTLSRKCARKCTRECTRRCPRKCLRRLRLFLCKTHQRVPTKTPTRVLTGNFPVLTKMYTKVRPWKLATGKYGCTEVRVYPTECGEQLGSSKSLVLKSFSLGREHFGTRPCQSPSRFGIRLHFLRPHFPSPNSHVLFSHVLFLGQKSPSKREQELCISCRASGPKRQKH